MCLESTSRGLTGSVVGTLVGPEGSPGSGSARGCVLIQGPPPRALRGWPCSPLEDCGRRACVPHEGWSEATLSPCHTGPSTWQLPPAEPWNQERCHPPNLEVTSQCFCHVLLIRASDQVRPTPKGRDDTVWGHQAGIPGSRTEAVPSLHKNQDVPWCGPWSPGPQAGWTGPLPLSCSPS
ncbi:hypothetical protein H1C71_012314, partial [Ictidomys tridecemlineatus]